MTILTAFIVGAFGPAAIAFGLRLGSWYGCLVCASGGAWLGVVGMGMLLGGPKSRPNSRDVGDDLEAIPSDEDRLDAISGICHYCGKLTRDAPCYCIRDD